MTGPEEMVTSSIAAYEKIERIRRYDADMDVMHPNRGKMADIAIDFLATSNPAPAHILDLGCGTGFVAAKLAERFSDAQITCLDGAETMLDLARSRLDVHARRLDFKRCDFQHIENANMFSASFDAVFSSYALHHLDGPQKRALLAACRARLKPDGWFFNADIVINISASIEETLQVLRAEGIVRRARAEDERFADAPRTRAWLETMERAEGDQPQDMMADLTTFAAAGFSQSAILWAEYREIVVGAQK